MHANVGAPWGIMVESGARYRTSADTLQVVLGPCRRGPRGRHPSQRELFIYNGGVGEDDRGPEEGAMRKRLI